MSQARFHRTLRAVNGKRLRVRLSVPTGGDACPLTLEPAANDELDFLPGVTFLEDMPRVRLATLPCRHAFGAMSLLYHFLRHNMMCPCCRAGHAAPLDPECVPRHCRAAIVARVQELAAQDLSEQLQSDAEAASAAQGGVHATDLAAHIGLAGIAANLGLILSGRGVDLSVFAHSNEPDSPALISFRFRLVPQLPADHVLDIAPSSLLAYDMPLQEHRRLTANLEEAAVQRLWFVVHGHSQADLAVELARAGPAPAVATGIFNRQLPAGDSRICLHYIRSNGALSRVSWITPARGLLPLFFD